uniref:PX domain-containing protein n=1 Tax=Eutreptiella gymnastica TaxID=73025 RepID=A0A7S4LLI9_9EUGL
MDAGASNANDSPHGPEADEVTVTMTHPMSDALEEDSAADDDHSMFKEEHLEPDEVVPIEGATPSSSAMVSSGANTTFEFRDVAKVWKVHQEGGLKLDYWSYRVVLETDYEMYTKHSGSSDLISVDTGRRYKEFEWLREALTLEYPHCIIPPLPGFALEGMLEKVDTVLGTPDQSQEIPALVTYRMRGISLFVKWLAQCPTLRTSKLLQTFMELSSEELASFQANWKKNEKVKPPVTTSTTLSGLLGTFRRSIQGVPKTFNADVIEAKKIVTQTEAVVGNLKENVEKLWDQIVSLCEGYVVERLDQSLCKSDEVMQAIVKTAVVVKRAVHSFSVENEELFLGLVIDLSFYGGLCTAAKTVIANLEKMAMDVQQLQQSKKPEEAEALQGELEKACDVFLEDYRHFHAIKRPSLKKMIENFALLTTNMDPKGFNWEKYCTPLIKMIPEPDW